MKLAIAILAVYFTIINGGIVKRESSKYKLDNELEIFTFNI